MTDAPDLDHLRVLIRPVPDFPSPGILFRDITPLLADAQGLAHAIDALASGLDPGDIDAIAGIEARGFLLAGAVALRLGCGLVPLRKPGKLPAARVGVDYALEYGNDRLEMHTGILSPGARVLVVDDVIATGGTAAAAGELIERSGARVAGFRFLIDLPALEGSARLVKRGWAHQHVLSF